MAKREKIEKLMEEFISKYPNGDSFELAEFMFDKGCREEHEDM